MATAKDPQTILRIEIEAINSRIFWNEERVKRIIELTETPSNTYIDNFNGRFTQI